jgi:hypothetical protein
MLRVRLVLIVAIAALVAPALAPCLVAAPVDHAKMACCARQADGTPAVQPCCAVGDEQPVAPPQDSARVLPTVHAIAVLPVPCALTTVPRLPGPDAPYIPRPSRLRSAVLLI